MLSCRGHGWDHRVDGGDAHCRCCCAGGRALRRRKVHGTLLQCLQYLPYLHGAPFMVVCLPSNIAMYRCILHVIYPPAVATSFFPPLQCSSSFRHCTIHGGVSNSKYYTLVQSTVFHCNVLALVATLSSHLQCNATLSCCNAPSSFKSPSTRCNAPCTVGW